jgi:CTP synthase
VKVNLDLDPVEIVRRSERRGFPNSTASRHPGAGRFRRARREGKMRAAGFARERKVPYFGICFGMQMAVIEAARNLAGIEGAGSTEFGKPDYPVVGLMTEWVRGNEKEVRTAGGDLGGTMRLGAYPATLKPGIAGRGDLRLDLNLRDGTATATR